MPKPRLSIIQFPHSGQEPKLKGASGICPWNIGDHRRKFMKAKGKIVNGATLSAETDVFFWGEWEPQSKYSRIVGNTTRPLYLHEPLAPNTAPGGVAGCCASSGCNATATNTQPQGGKNTDPYVFGHYFIYSNCRQLINGRQRQTACLEIGSLILFGSIFSDVNGPCFGLDTVFVVDDYRPYTAATYQIDLKGFYPPIFPNVMLFNNWGNQSGQHTCYHGATFHNPRNSMYSFVPCKTGAAGAKGFTQPILRNADFACLGYKQDVLRDNCSRNFYKSLGTLKITDADVRKVWDRVRGLIASQGFSEGVEIY